MEISDLQRTIEALLFVSDKPLTSKQISEVCEGAGPAEIKDAINNLKEFYNNPDHGVRISEVAGGLQFTTNPECADFVKKLYKTKKVFRLSGPALETLAIIAYKQPVTRAEIEFIRGVNVDGVVRTLEERDLIKTKGRKEVPGRPLLYGTSEEFLHYFGLKSIADLPSLEEFEATLLEKNREAEEQLAAEAAGEQNGEVQEDTVTSSEQEEAPAGTDETEGREENLDIPDTGDEQNEHSEITQGN